MSCCRTNCHLRNPTSVPRLAWQVLFVASSTWNVLIATSLCIRTVQAGNWRPSCHLCWFPWNALHCVLDFVVTSLMSLKEISSEALAQFAVAFMDRLKDEPPGEA